MNQKLSNSMIKSMKLMPNWHNLEDIMSKMIQKTEEGLLIRMPTKTDMKAAGNAIRHGIAFGTANVGIKLTNFGLRMMTKDEIINEAVGKILNAHNMDEEDIV